MKKPWIQKTDSSGSWGFLSVSSSLKKTERDMFGSIKGRPGHSLLLSKWFAQMFALPTLVQQHRQPVGDSE